MKTRLLFTAVSVFLMMTTAQATEDVQSHNNEENFKGIMTGYRNAQPVLFQFNGVDYAVFPDGSLQYELPQRMITRQRGNRWNRLEVRYNRRGQLIAARGCVNNREVDCRFQEFGTFQDADQDAWDDGIFFKRAPGQQ